MIERDQNGVAHIVSLSGGKDSTAMALQLADVEPRPYTYICTPTGDELPEMFAHWRNLGKMLGKILIPVMADTGLKGTCREQKALPNQRMRFCTRLLKLRPAARFLTDAAPCVCYVGLRADEETREGARRGGDYIATDIPGILQDYPLQRWGWDLSQVMGYLDSIGVVIPRRTDCARCFYQTIGEWWQLWRDHPDIFSDAATQELDFGHTFRSRKFKDGQPVMRSKGNYEYQASHRDSWPAWLTDLGELFARGHVPKNANQMDLVRRNTCRVCSL